MKVIDITASIHRQMTVYKNNEENRPIIENIRNFDNSSMYESSIWMNMHTGTHIDFALHAVKDGTNSNNHNISRFVSPCKVFDLTHVDDKIGLDDVKTLGIEKGDFVLFKTKNSFDQGFNYNYIFVDQFAAKYLANQSINGVGIDSLGIERNQPNHETHKHLLSKDIIILEGAQLAEVEPGSYTLVCLPLKIDNVEALPVRAVLLQE